MCLEFMVMKACKCNINVLPPRAGVFPPCSLWEHEHLLSCNMREEHLICGIFLFGVGCLGYA